MREGVYIAPSVGGTRFKATDNNISSSSQQYVPKRIRRGLNPGATTQTKQQYMGKTLLPKQQYMGKTLLPQ